MPYGHASMLLRGEGNEATEPYNIYATLRGSSTLIHILCKILTKTLVKNALFDCTNSYKILAKFLAENGTKNA